MNLNKFERFILWFSKTDIEALGFCTNETRMTQISVAIMVICTGIFAFFSAFFAIDSNFHSTVAAIIVGFIYSLTIISFDREIVSSTSKSGLIPRIPLALLIGVVIAYPLEMRLLDGQIKAKISENIQKEINITLSSDVDTLGRYKKQLNALQVEIDETSSTATKNRNRQSDAILGNDPSGKVGIGKYSNNLKALADDAEEKVKRLKIDEAKAKADHDALDKKINKEKTEIEERRGDLLSKAVALSELKNPIITGLSPEEAKRAKNIAGEVKMLSWALMLFFIMLELFPTVLKFFIPRNEYMAYRDARRLLSVNKIHHYHNILQEKIKAETDPENLVSLYHEITDQMERLVEDNPNHSIANIQQTQQAAASNGGAQTGQQAVP